ncbi:proton pump-interactor 2-like [Capsella rubella]|uniref:proton pump-interactor 2-like n=1 Tax=Capsella rubella TaxID=81985 RepID=UPI000CD56E23|nr:proton pump-interactor 2-like [Capsella rubella]
MSDTNKLLNSFYIVKHHPYDDPHIKAVINEADQEIYRCNKRRIYISNAQKSKRAEISSLFSQMETLVPKSERYRQVFEAKKREFDTLQESIRKPPNGKILSEDSLVQNESSINRVTLLALELNEVKEELDAITWYIRDLEDQLGKSQSTMRYLDGEMTLILEKRDKSYERIKMLRLQRDKGNATFFQSLEIMRKAKELAASGNVRDLQVFASSEVDRFITHWNNDKAFRADYVKRCSSSLREKQLRDGRIKYPKVQVVREKQAPIKTITEGEEVHKMNRAEDSSSKSPLDGHVTTDKGKENTTEKVPSGTNTAEQPSKTVDKHWIWGASFATLEL